MSFSSAFVYLLEGLFNTVYVDRYEVAPRDDGEDSASGEEEEDEVRHLILPNIQSKLLSFV